jgi:uncharacterized phage protein (TIGR02216 family)
MTDAGGGGRFPWGALMRAGMGRLRIAPDQFWRMTPKELAAALDGAAGRAGAAHPMGRAAFEALMARFPDSSVDGGHDDA